MPAHDTERRLGIAYVAGAYVSWGLLPIYWRVLSGVPPLQILAHRVIWSFLFLLILLRSRGRLRAVRQAFAEPHSRHVVTATAALIAVNWLMYITAVTSGHVVEASLGYFMNPLVSVLLGALFLNEHLDGRRRAAVLLAAFGVGYLTITSGSAPWISLGLAGSFGLYSLLRKTASFPAMAGLFIETALLGPLALGFLLAQEALGTGVTGHAGMVVHLFLLGAGVVTATPLVWFVSGVRRIPLGLAGFLQYISPTLQFLLGVFAFGEPFVRDQLVAFAFIWSGLVLFTIASTRAPAPARPPTAQGGS